MNKLLKLIFVLLGLTFLIYAIISIVDLSKFINFLDSEEGTDAFYLLTIFFEDLEKDTIGLLFRLFLKIVTFSLLSIGCFLLSALWKTEQSITANSSYSVEISKPKKDGWKCKFCGTENSKLLSTCYNCKKKKTDILYKNWTCSNCGSENGGNSIICWKCRKSK